MVRGTKITGAEFILLDFESDLSLETNKDSLIKTLRDLSNTSKLKNLRMNPRDLISNQQFLAVNFLFLFLLE